MAIAPKKPIPLPKSEQQQVQDLEKLLRRGVPALISPEGERIELPGTVVEVLRTAVEFMSHGQAVTLIPDNQAVTTQRAADILGMSRPFFIKQLESGLMAHHRVGNQRRVYLRDVLEFARKRARSVWLRWTSWHAMRSKPACTSGMYSPKAARTSEERSSPQSWMPPSWFQCRWLTRSLGLLLAHVFFAEMEPSFLDRARTQWARKAKP